MSPRYEFRRRQKDPYTGNYVGDETIFDTQENRFVWTCPGDILDILNRAHDAETELAKVKAAFAIEQQSSMELARKLANL